MIDNEQLHNNVDYTPYEGIRLHALPRVTLSRGEAVWSSPHPQVRAGRGRFLPCAKPAPARPKSERSAPVARGKHASSRRWIRKG